VPVFQPCARSSASASRQTDPFPFEPATWSTVIPASGSRSAFIKARVRSSESSTSPRRKRGSRSRLGSVRDRRSIAAKPSSGRGKASHHGGDGDRCDERAIRGKLARERSLPSPPVAAQNREPARRRLVLPCRSSDPEEEALVPIPSPPLVLLLALLLPQSGDATVLRTTVDFELLKEVNDATEAERIVREPQPFLHLLIEAGKLEPGDFTRLGAHVADEALYRELLLRPAAWRGLPVTAKARFNFATEEKVPLGARDPAGEELQFRYWRGVATDDFGRIWSYSLLEEPTGLVAGDVIKIEGFFFKKLALFDRHYPEELIDPTAHLVGKRIVKSWLPMAPVTELSSELLATVRDDSLDERRALPDEPLWHLLSFVQHADAEWIAASAEASEAAFDRENPDARDATYQALLREPALHRGTPVRLVGALLDQPPSSRDEENPLELPHIWHTFIVHGGPTFTYLVSAEPPPEWAAGQAAVQVEGLFFKLHAYEARNDRMVTCPVVVVKRFVPLHIGIDELRSGISWILITISAPLVAVMLLLAMRDRAAAAALQEARIARRRSRRPPPSGSGAGNGG
jgi:hypothetical protein